MPGQAQPDVMPFLRMRMDNVVILEPGLSPTSIVSSGTDVQLRVEVGFDGILAPLLVGQTFNVFHHVTNIESGATSVLNGGSFVVTGANLSHAAVNSSLYSTSGAAADFPTPAGSAAGTFRILTHVHAASAAVEPIVTAFFDGTILMVS